MAATLTREQLYDLVWSEPLSRLAPRYGLSDVGLAKICQRLRIPRPHRGHWAQVAAGKRVRRPKLPTLRPEEADALPVVELGGRVVRRKGPTGPVADQERYEADHPIRVPKRLSSAPHPLVRDTREWFRSRPGSRVRQTGKRLDVQVDDKSLGRALRIFDALLKALDKRAIQVTLTHDDPPKTVVIVRGQELEIRLTERRKQVERPPTDWELRWASHDPEPRTYTDLHYTGELALVIDEYRAQNLRKRWRDAQRQRLEDCLNRFVVGLVRAAEAKAAWELEWQEQHQARLERQQQRLEQLRREEEERRRGVDLLSDAEAWEKARSIRALVSAVREAALDKARESERLADWLAWADAYADGLDPVNEIVAAAAEGSAQKDQESAH